MKTNEMVKSEVVVETPISQLLDGITDAVNRTSGNMTKVGSYAAEVAEEAGKKLDAATQEAIDELRQELTVNGPDAQEVKDEIKAAIREVVQGQFNTPREAVAMIRQTHQRVKEMMSKATDIMVAKRLLPIAKEVCSRITRADIAAAQEFADVMDSMDGMFSDDSDVTKAAKLLASRRAK